MSSFIFGYILGNKRLKQPSDIIVTIQEPVIDTVYIPEPVSKTTPTNPILPLKTDTVYKIQIVDTAAIIAEYIQDKEYSFNVFDNKYGRLDISNNVQYNSLTGFSYTFTPVTTHEIRTTPVPKYIPFAMMQYNTLNTVSIGGGLFIGNIGGYYNYNMRLDGISNHSLGIIYKFQ